MIKKKFISILISNYNKEKFIKNSIKSVLNQKYNNFEVILFDDASTDNSLLKIRNFKKVKLIKNKFKINKYPALSQLGGIIKAFKKSKGSLICLLDSDDKFSSFKLIEVNNFFKKKNINFLVNLPYIKKNKFTVKNKNKNISIWPTIFPTSCVSIRRRAFVKFLKFAHQNKYPLLEIDARLAIFAKYILNQNNLINKELTFYVSDPKGISSYSPKFSKLWWLKRKQSFSYLQKVLNQSNQKFIKGIDYYFTKLVNIFIN